MNIYWESFKTFTRIGMFTIGGGYAMLPLIEADVVDKKKWIDKEEFVDLVAIAQSCPGILAVNISIFLGYKLKGVPGSIICTLGTILPSFLIILLIALFFQTFRENKTVQSIFLGIRPAVVALIAAPTFISALLIWQMEVSPVYIIILAGLFGFLYGKLVEQNDK